MFVREFVIICMRVSKHALLEQHAAIRYYEMRRREVLLYVLCVRVLQSRLHCHASRLQRLTK